MTTTVQKTQYIIASVASVPQFYISKLNPYNFLPSFSTSLGSALTFDTEQEAELVLKAQRRLGNCHNCKIRPITVTIVLKSEDD